jgi:hypothetical protein
VARHRVGDADPKLQALGGGGSYRQPHERIGALALGITKGNSVETLGFRFAGDRDSLAPNVA